MSNDQFPEMNFNVKNSNGEVRIGWLPNVIARAKYAFAGSIRAPFTYFIGKYKLHSEVEPGFDKFAMVVEVDRAAMKITYRENNLTDQGSAVVTGSASISKEITDLGINSPSKKYGAKTLGDALRMSRLMFTSSDECLKIVAALNNFKAKVEQDIQAADDKKGNKTSSFDQRIQQPHDLRFTLEWPVISGEAKIKFLVEVNYDVRDRAIEFWLESVEMHEAISEQCQTMMDEQIKLFKDESITVIEQ